MAAPAQIIKLIARFKEHRASYVAGRYNETQVRREFLDPFFKALGWDIDNEKGKSEAYKDVIHEDAIQIGGIHKAPDYCMRVEGIRKFFVEAKKPAVDIKSDISPAFQVRRYGWSAKLSLSILTDFEEFAVYDCRVKPTKSDGPAVARILYFTVEELAERWDEIASIFSPEAIGNGSFDKFAEASKLKRGTQEVDDAFLEEIEEWRVSLAKNIAVNNQKLSQRELNFAVQVTIDRIIFLRICEDRGIEPYLRLQSETNGADIYGRLKKLFRDADGRYNSGLFHFRDEKDQGEPADTFTLGLAIDDDVLKKIIKSLYPPDCPYAFSVFSADILGQVYERFLGKVIRLTEGHHAKVEEKPEVRKAGGVYYTPTYIVDYIVKHTVGKLLQGKTPKEVAELKIVDPACGSGSFLLGAYQFLLNWHLEMYAQDPKKWKKQLVQRAKNEWFLSTAERKRILLDNIFGVDIDSQAVEVTKLSLLLKVLEGESQVSIQDQFAGMKERVLPDLGKNIQCGNSLIGPDFYEGQQQGMFEMDEEEKYRINVFDWESAFPQVFKRNNSGFDGVIGNPPYVIAGKEDVSEGELAYLHQYKVAQYKMDLFHLFIQKGIDLLRQNGQMGYIVPNTWLTLQFTEKLRRYILSEASPEEIVLFDHRVFEDADVHTMLLLLKKRKASESSRVLLKKIGEARNVSDIEHADFEQLNSKAWADSDDAIFETRITGDAGKIVQKLLKLPRLESVARISLGCQAYNSSKHTKEQIENRVFHAEKKLGKEYLPELAGNDVSRYLINRVKGKWIKYGSWLHDFRPIDWLQGPRILVREITGAAPHSIQASYVEETFCNYKTILNVNPSENTAVSMKYLLGLLNSKLISFLYPFLSNKLVAQTFPRLSVGDLRKLPIIALNLSVSSERKQHDKMIHLVDQMLLFKKLVSSANTPHEQESLKRQIEATDRQIDQLVYGLYGLSEQEVRLIENPHSV